jgi:hypothetical protein
MEAGDAQGIGWLAKGVAETYAEGLRLWQWLLLFCPLFTSTFGFVSAAGRLRWARDECRSFPRSPAQTAGT